jgi:twinkle protein
MSRLLAKRTFSSFHYFKTQSAELQNAAQPVAFVKDSLFFEKDILSQLESGDKMNGIPSQSLPSFTKILKGLRPGELTVFTGSTGCGKTTVLSQLSLDFASQNVRTLWGSFEIRNSRLIKKMMHQYAGEDGLHKDNFREVLGSFKLLPLYFLDFFGSTPLEIVGPILAEAHEKLGVQHIILDNLQFMLSGQDSGVGDKYDLMDKTVAAVRNLCNKLPVHVTLVIHPRKELDGTHLGISSIYGSAKATQEADNIVILQKDLENNRYMDIKKNRFDGDLGMFQLEYDTISNLVKEVEKAPGKQRQRPYAAKSGRGGAASSGPEHKLNSL